MHTPGAPEGGVRPEILAAICAARGLTGELWQGLEGYARA